MKRIQLLKPCQSVALLLTAVSSLFLALFCGEVAAADTLQSNLDRLLIQSGLTRRGQISIQIVSLNDGKILYQYNPDLAINPASNVKLVTAAAALRELGPDSAFKTEFWSESPLKKGRLHNVWIKGHGDPVLVTEEIDEIVHRFKTAGLEEIEGDLSIDESYFDRYPLMTYLSDVREKVYSVVTGPLSCNFNTVVIKASPGRRTGDRPLLTLDPPTPYLQIRNQARTVGRGGRVTLAVSEGSEEGVLIVWGNLPLSAGEFSLRRGIRNPGLFTGTAILEALKKEGIPVRGRVKIEAIPSRAVLIYSHASPPLHEILKGLGKFSNNFIAEQLLKTLGAAHYAPPGTTQKGLKVLEGYLHSLGIRNPRYFLDNGSGLSRLNRLSSGQLVKVLLDLYHARWRDSWISSLSIGGIDGTLKQKFRRSTLKGKVFAKTGTLNGVSALSGYLIDGRKKAAFSFLFNDVPASPDKLSRVEEKILQAVSGDLIQ